MAAPVTHGLRYFLYDHAHSCGVDREPSTPLPLTQLVEPTSSFQADNLLTEIIALPSGFLARLYVALYDGCDLRIDAARTTAKNYMKGLT